MTPRQAISGSTRTIGVVLMGLGWLFVPASRALACSHPTFVSFSSATESAPRPTTAPVHKRTKPTAAPQNPVNPLGPCQGPQCDTRPGRPDRPLTSPAPIKTRDHGNIAYTESSADERTPASHAWLDFETPAPLQFSDSIFHPPRDRS
jgi:hypothetical protein